MNILILSGVNLDLLGTRENHIYGKDTLADMENLLTSEWAQLRKTFPKFSKVGLTFFQSNDEAKFLEMISKKWAGIVINPGAWTHTSLALADRLRGVGIPFVEVHMSNLHAREDFRKVSFLAPHALGVVQGFGIRSYLLGLEGLVSLTSKT